MTPTKPFLLDASAWIAAVEPADRYHASASKLAVARECVVAGLDLSLYEVANVLGAREGQAEKAGLLARLIVGRCGASLQRVGLDLIDAAVDLAAEHSLTAYDAAYVAAARRYDWTLVSTDIADLVSKDLAVTPDAAVYP